MERRPRHKTIRETTMSGKTALITNATSDAGLAAAKSLADAGYKVSAVDLRKLPFGLPSRYWISYDAVSRGSQEAFEQELLDLVWRLRPDVFLPLGTRFAFMAARHRHGFPAGTAAGSKIMVNNLAICGIKSHLPPFRKGGL